MVVPVVVVGYEHKDIVELATLCLVDGGHKHLATRKITKVLYGRLKHKLLEVAEVFLLVCV
jgi:hypothetical protein